MLELVNPLPLEVVGGPGWTGPTGRGLCYFVIEGAIDADIVWVIAMDDTGEIWSVRNPFVRAVKNKTLGRRIKVI